MSSTKCAQLTKEQQTFLNSLEEEFKDRYTEKDEEFKAVLNEELPLPPLVANWREFRQPDDRFGNDRNYRDRDHMASRSPPPPPRHPHHTRRQESPFVQYPSQTRDRNNFKNTYRPY